MTVTYRHYVKHSELLYINVNTCTNINHILTLSKIIYYATYLNGISW